MRSRTVEWHDPLVSVPLARRLDGLEFVQALVDGDIPASPMLNLMNARARAGAAGRVEISLEPDESMYNSIGAVHGGAVCTLLDSVVGAAVQSTLAAGWGFTSVEIKVNYMRPITHDSGVLTGVGTVKRSGRRVAFAEGEAVDSSGRVVATATSTMLLFEVAND
jgi:uncharacterized protein (TIGR00369 family)